MTKTNGIENPQGKDFIIFACIVALTLIAFYA